MTTDMVELFRLGILRLKAKYRPTIEEMANAAGVSSRHIQGFLSDKERKGLGRRAQQNAMGHTSSHTTELYTTLGHNAIIDEITGKFGTGV